MNRLSKIKNRKFSHQKGLCFYCMQPMWKKDPEQFSDKFMLTLKQAKFFQCTIEHLKARCDGGDNSESNIVMACMFCNQTRHRAKHPLCPVAFKRKVVGRISAGKWHPTVVTRQDN